jgi:hypothetical protein
MKFRIALLAIALCLFGSGSAQAAQSISIEGMFKAFSTSIPIPAEWEGIWSAQDSTYTCSPMTLQVVTTEQDTLCSGQVLTFPEVVGFTIDCSGTADGTTVHYTCTGGGELFPGCTETINVTTDVTRTGDSFYSVTTLSVTYTGCPIADHCTISHTHGTRIGNGVAECAVPAKPGTWGRVKATYR